MLSVCIGLLYSGAITLFERITHPRDYREIVEEYADLYAVPESVVYAVIKCESGFDPTAVSHAGAIGLMQMMPQTFEDLCALTGEHYDEGLLYEPETSIRYGTYLLSILYLKYGNWETAYAAYNAGEPAVDGWLDDPAHSDGNGNLTDIPYKETRKYVKRVARARTVYERLYG